MEHLLIYLDVADLADLLKFCMGAQGSQHDIVYGLHCMLRLLKVRILRHQKQQQSKMEQL